MVALAQQVLLLGLQFSEMVELREGGPTGVLTQFLFPPMILPLFVLILLLFQFLLLDCLLPYSLLINPVGLFDVPLVLESSLFFLPLDSLLLLGCSPLHHLLHVIDLLFPVLPCEHCLCFSPRLQVLEIFLLFELFVPLLKHLNLLEYLFAKLFLLGSVLLSFLRFLLLEHLL